MSFTAKELFDTVYTGRDWTTSKTVAEYVANLDTCMATLPAQKAAIRVCRAYGIRGICDPAYIANLIQEELDKL